LRGGLVVADDTPSASTRIVFDTACFIAEQVEVADAERVIERIARGDP
jgi:hypothetical protein